MLIQSYHTWLDSVTLQHRHLVCNRFAYLQWWLNLTDVGIMEVWGGQQKQMYRSCKYIVISLYTIVSAFLAIQLHLNSGSLELLKSCWLSFPKMWVMQSIYHYLSFQMTAILIWTIVERKILSEFTRLRILDSHLRKIFDPLAGQHKKNITHNKVSVIHTLVSRSSLHPATSCQKETGKLQSY